ncbi:hypothetical protein NUU61_007407 [Penicillium alfredii]|uniref:Uncharacterized protein n=1 Tax=Penicillium alfredii TaxID=1506179 RepID=A0A9W9K555_9EURO|nr:uncharacterized protein NUU61_007407 [Penicillium alfredii]KAJ5092537.1 hypothetical protein NUU61_007407 [Penicillium alfredii]
MAQPSPEVNLLDPWEKYGTTVMTTLLASKEKKNRQCTGPKGIYTGHGSSECRTDILNGGALAYIPVDIDWRCTVNIFRDDNCTSGARIGMVRVDGVRKCSPVAEKNTMIASFEVICS